MEWSEFQNDDLNSGEYANPPDGESLFKKVIHDILECLIGYKECIKLAITLKEDIPENTMNWLLKWKDPTDTWIAEIISLQMRYKDLPSESLEWSTAIAAVGKVLTRVSEIRDEIDVLILPSSENRNSL